jgi:glucose/arabinose dehydrogenase
MKKVFYSLTLLILGLTLIYFLQPLIGLNISVSEVMGQFIPFLKPTISKNITQKNSYTLKPYVTNLQAPRFMHVTTNGDLLVTEPSKGNLILIPYQKPLQKKVLLSGLNKPHSMDIYDNYLYIAEENAIGRIRYDAKEARTFGNYERIINPIPADGGHWTRTIKFGPDGFGYVSIGSSCNVCIETNPLRASISRFKPGDNQLTIYAKGLRNSVGFDWSPLDGELYATENSRDFLGDHFPPEELNLIKQNQTYGWPYANGNRVPDPKFGAGHQQMIKESQIPVYSFSAHQAPLGITFIKNHNSPLYKKALVAFHGSWNSSIKVGYKVVSLSFNNGSITQDDFITGFLKDGTVIGRPVHIVEGKEGELYLSDDFNGVIYLIELKPTCFTH